MAGSANNIRIAPVNLLWQIEAREELDLSTATDFDGTSFKLPLPDGSVIVPWFDEDASSSAPTAGAGETLLEVDVLSTDSSSAKATKLATALDGDSNFSASASGSIVTVDRTAVGEVAAPSDADTGITISRCLVGKDFDLGLIQGDITMTLSPQNLSITAQQFGTTILGAINQGFEQSVSVTLQETQSAKLKELYKIYGGAFTPSGGTEVFGVGTSAIGKNMLVEAARLVAVPVNSSTDNLGRVTSMLSLPVPETLTFSGENPRILEVTFAGYPDLNRDTRANIVAFGDESQDF